MDYKEFFTTNNKSGWKTRENVLAKNEPEIYKTLKEFVNEHNLSDLKFVQQVWHFMNNDPHRKKCLNCGNDVNFKNNLAKGYSDFCSLNCANTSGLLVERIVKSNQEKFGVDYFPQHKEHMKKVKKTKKERYGNENYNNIEKGKQTKEELYGSSTYTNKNKRNKTIRLDFIERLKKRTDDIVIKYDLNDEDITLKCSKCDKEYLISNNLLNSRLNVNVSPCIHCNPVSEVNSIQEKELLEYVKSILPNENIISKDRSVLKNDGGLELDILIPNLIIAIEFDGLYWHSNKFCSYNHLMEKTKLCEKKGIQLIHIFEDEWMYKRNIVQSILNNRLNVNTVNIFGRKTEIREVSSEESRLFLDNNHIQGCVNSNIRLGLYYEDELVNLMTFGKLRKVMGYNDKEGHYELVRFCNKLNTNVIGGFSKLFKYFIKNYSPKEITTYSDNRYFNGDVYLKNGFEFKGNTRPNYWYIKKSARLHRFKFRKSELVKQGYDPNMSEAEIMESRKINKIYDCGNKKWVLKLY